MLFSTTTPEAKRTALRQMLAGPSIVQFPGAYTPLSTKLIQEQGFDGVYISGAVLANELGFPDIGLTSLTEVAARAGQIARITDLPALVDADTGFGEPMNVARTDIRGTDGLTAATDRAKALVDAGADAIFPEAMADLSEFEAMRKAVDVPILANMTEFGKSQLFTADQLQEVGVNMIIYPVTLMRSALGAMERVLQTIRADRTQEAAVPDMLTRARLYELVDYNGYNQFDSSVFDFEVPGLHR